MSFSMIAWAFKQQPKTPTQKFVLLALADFHNGTTGQCDPSFETIASKTGYQKRAVQYAIKDLQKQRFIKYRKRRVNSHKHTSNSYTFCTENDSQGVVHMVHPPSALNAPKPVITNNKENAPKARFKEL